MMALGEADLGTVKGSQSHDSPSILSRTTSFSANASPCFAGGKA